MSNIEIKVDVMCQECKKMFPQPQNLTVTYRGPGAYAVSYQHCSEHE